MMIRFLFICVCVYWRRRRRRKKSKKKNQNLLDTVKKAHIMEWKVLTCAANIWKVSTSTRHKQHIYLIYHHQDVTFVNYLQNSTLTFATNIPVTSDLSLTAVSSVLDSHASSVCPLPLFFLCPWHAAATTLTKTTQAARCSPAVNLDLPLAALIWKFICSGWRTAACQPEWAQPGAALLLHGGLRPLGIAI